MDWQRHYAKVKACPDGGATLEEIRPGVTVGGEDTGLWLARQRTGWQQSADRQRERLTALGITPTAPTTADGTAASDGQAGSDGRTRQAPWAVVVPTDTTAWDRALAALRQYLGRGHTRVPRKWVEAIRDQTGQKHPSKLGVWLSNQKSRRDRLPHERVKKLEELGVQGGEAPGSRTCPWSWNHPRGCGEQSKDVALQMVSEGPSPRGYVHDFGQRLLTTLGGGRDAAAFELFTRSGSTGYGRAPRAARHGRRRWSIPGFTRRPPESMWASTIAAPSSAAMRWASSAARRWWAGSDRQAVIASPRASPGGPGRAPGWYRRCLGGPCPPNRPGRR
ncbi:helicase associated domain-containing protein [Streptomyces macrosporus]|uniref:helicase associated domain-containing protein n=1 Tax=Streptomyces macrosporus TaxID=44032 RepID=UPI003CD05FCD